MLFSVYSVGKRDNRALPCYLNVFNKIFAEFKTLKEARSYIEERATCWDAGQFRAFIVFCDGKSVYMKENQ